MTCIVLQCIQVVYKNVKLCILHTDPCQIRTVSLSENFWLWFWGALLQDCTTKFSTIRWPSLSPCVPQIMKIVSKGISYTCLISGKLEWIRFWCWSIVHVTSHLTLIYIKLLKGKLFWAMFAGFNQKISILTTLTELTSTYLIYSMQCIE